ncbi:hypothetical protein [Deinococcus aetherius]|nr:hypothetical protein [Deinococcus aetherius]
MVTVELTDEHILDMQLADREIVMSLRGVLPPLRPGDRLRFPSFGRWTVLRVGLHPPHASGVEVTLQLDEAGDDVPRDEARAGTERGGPAEFSHCGRVEE